MTLRIDGNQFLVGPFSDTALDPAAHPELQDDGPLGKLVASLRKLAAASPLPKPIPPADSAEYAAYLRALFDGGKVDGWSVTEDEGGDVPSIKPPDGGRDWITTGEVGGISVEVYQGARPPRDARTQVRYWVSVYDDVQVIALRSKIDCTLAAPREPIAGVDEIEFKRGIRTRPRAVVGLALVFEPTHTEIEHIEVMNGDLCEQVEVTGERNALRVVRWATPVRPEEGVTVRIYYRFDPPVVRHKVWLTPERGRCGRLDPHRLPEVLPINLAGQLRRAIPDGTALLKQWQAEIAAGAATSGGGKYNEFAAIFVQIEALYNPSLLNMPATISTTAAGGLASGLEGRWQTRALFAARGLMVQFQKEISASRLSALQQVEADLRGIFAPGGRQLGRGRMRQLFTAWATGKLRFGDTTLGVPDGLNLICFAELALMLEDHGHQSVWQKYFPPMAQAVQTFVRTYKVEGEDNAIEFHALGDKVGAPPNDTELTDIAAQWPNDLGESKHHFAQLCYKVIEDEGFMMSYTQSLTPPPIALAVTPFDAGLA